MKKELTNGFYYIECSVDEYRSAPQAYFPTLEEAKENARYFSDWFSSMGTGHIYFQPFGLKETKSTVLYGNLGTKVYGIGAPRKFICRAMGIDDATDKVIFSDKEF